MDRRPLLAATTSVLTFSVGPVLVAASTATAPVFAFWRGWLTILATVAGMALLKRARKGKWPNGRQWRPPIIAGCLNGIATLLFIEAIKLTSVAGTTLIYQINPVLVALWAIPLFGERPGMRFRLWTMVAILGSIVVILGDSSGPEGNPLGVAMAGVSVILYSIQMVITKAGRRTVDTIPMHLIMIFSGTVFVTLFALATGQDFLDMTRADALSVAGIVLLPSGLGALLFIWAIRWLPANIPPLINLPIPFLAGALAWLVLGETITVAHLIGGVVMLVGIGAALLSASGRRMLDAGSIPKGPPVGPPPTT